MTAQRSAEQAFEDFNWERSHEASRRDVARARAAIQAIQRIPVNQLKPSQLRMRQRSMQVLGVRVRHPHATLAQLAMASGVNKDMYGARLKRAFVFAERMECFYGH